MNRWLIAGGAVVLGAVLAIGISQAGGGGSTAKSELGSCTGAARAAAGAPAPLVSLQKQACQLLPGGATAFKARLTALHGHPVVVNKWASWCGPCRSEFPLFQHAAKTLGRNVAFVGVDSSDNEGDARTFLSKFPVPYPSYVDHDTTIAQVFHANIAFPTTAFYDATGKLQYIHQGQYPSQAKLLTDIRRYAGG